MVKGRLLSERESRFRANKYAQTFFPAPLKRLLFIPLTSAGAWLAICLLADAVRCTCPSDVPSPSLGTG